MYLALGESQLGGVNIRRATFQSDSLSPLLFVVALIPIMFVLRKMYQRYLFGKEKGK